MKLLITGCRGQLGRELQKQLATGHSEIGDIPGCYKNAAVTAVDIDSFDLSDRAAVLDFITGGGYDVVFNCAAYTNVNKCESDYETAYKANALAPKYLAEACDRTCTKLVHVSTDYVFPGDGTEPYREFDLTGPRSVYGKTKLAGEQFVRENCRRYFIVRTAWLYGYIGNNFVKTMLRITRENGAATVVSDQLGNPTSAADVAHHLLLLAATEFYGVYHCTNSGVCSWYDFTCEIVRLSGIQAQVKPCTTDEYPTPAKRPAYSALDHMALRATVGDHMRAWQDALKEYIERLPEEEKKA
ncbi:MAG: dTDP-4-dehydrorhamnose reductase [Oscillospiraceae bacterium]|nr:dTDP-4-dehydrorhamnose reductase [Oscillospiraceae bacterium]